MSKPQLQDGLSPEWHARYQAECAALRRRFFLRTAEQYYAKEGDERDVLEALGFDFKEIGSPHTVVKTANPAAPFELETISDLLNFIAKHGTVAITLGHELIILGNTGHHLPRLTETGTPSEGYTSVGGQPPGG